MATHKRRRFYKRKVKGKKSVVKVVKKVLRSYAENKYHDFTVTATMTNTPVINEIMNVTQGTTDVTRIGDAVELIRGEIRFSVLAQSTAANVHPCRVLIFQWFENTVPVIGNILTNAAAGVATVSSYAMDYFRKHVQFKVLYDRTFPLAANGGGTSAFFVHHRLKGFRKHVSFIAGAASPATNDLFVVFMSDTATATEVPTFSFYSRLEWIDL